LAAAITVEVYNPTTTTWNPVTKVGNAWTYNWGQLSEEVHQLQFRVRNTGDKTAKSLMVRETSDGRGYGSLSLNGTSWVTDGTPLTLGNVEPTQAASWFVKLDIPLGALVAAGLAFNFEVYNY